MPGGRTPPHRSWRTPTPRARTRGPARPPPTGAAARRSTPAEAPRADEQPAQIWPHHAHAANPAMLSPACRRRGTPHSPQPSDPRRRGTPHCPQPPDPSARPAPAPPPPHAPSRGTRRHGQRRPRRHRRYQSFAQQRSPVAARGGGEGRGCSGGWNQGSARVAPLGASRGTRCFAPSNIGGGRSFRGGDQT